MLFTKDPYLSVILSVLLLPLTLIYLLVVTSRNFLFDSGILKAHKPDIFTVSIGNITVGGTGKTPTVISLVKSLSSKGLLPLVVTRGYGRKSTGRIIVDSGTSAFESGDEAFTIFSKTGVNVVCDKDRASAIKDLGNKFDLIVLDDAFQHRKVKKDIDIVLIDESRFLGNGLLLPSGILRDTVSRLKDCDIIILSKVKDINSDSVRNKLAYLKKFGKRILISKLDYSFISDGKIKKDLSSISAMNISLFCGIGNPEDFFDIFSGNKIILKKAFSDHCDYSESEFSELSKMKSSSDLLVTTYKDFVKIPAETIGKLNVMYLDIDLKFYDQSFDPYDISDILKGFELGKK